MNLDQELKTTENCEDAAMSEPSTVATVGELPDVAATSSNNSSSSEVVVVSSSNKDCLEEETKNRIDSNLKAGQDSNEDEAKEEEERDSTQEKINGIVNAIEILLRAITEVIAITDAQNYSKLLQCAKSAYSLYTNIGQVMELSALHLDVRSKLNSMGQKMWLLVKKNPLLFHDHISPLVISDDLKQDSSKDSTEEKIEFEPDRAAASGYIRSIAARLVLIESFQTLDMVGVHEESKLKMAGYDEMNFGLKCFARSGRALLAHALDPLAAYSTLSLAVACWQRMKNRDDWKESSKSQPEFDANFGSDEIFDSLLLLVDCAFQLKSSTDQYHNDLSKSKSILGSSETIIHRLTVLQNFVKNNYTSDGEDDSTPSGLLTIQRDLPSLARISYKLGNKFAQLNDYSSSEKALYIALSATDECLGQIETLIKERTGKQLKVDSLLQSLQIQEQEMLVVSKQCFYILCHVFQSQTKQDEARKCLDRIEMYIDKQKQRNDELFEETINKLRKSDANSSQQNNYIDKSEFVLEGPKMQDKADMETRAKSAHAKAKVEERAERANLVFSRIMLVHNSTPKTEDEELFIDKHLATLIELSAPIGSLNHEGMASFRLGSLLTSNQEVFNVDMSRNNAIELALVVAQKTLNRRILFLPSGTLHKYKEPYDLLFDTFQNNCHRHLAISLACLNACLTSAKDLRDSISSSTSFSHETIITIDERAIQMGERIVRQLSKSLSTTQSSTPNSSLFSECETMNDQGLILEESRTQFARAISFYHSLNDSAHFHTISWCDLLLEVFKLYQRYAINSIAKEEFDRTRSGIMAVKAIALSMSEHFGAGLKAAREAWESCSTEEGNLITLFCCSARYESYSTMDEQNSKCNNTLLELDTAISTFLTVSKIDQSSPSPEYCILRTFPILSNSCVDINSSRENPLLLGLQQRWITQFIKSTSMVLAVVNENGSTDTQEIPEGQSLFNIMRPYLVNFEYLISKALCSKDSTWQPNEHGIHLDNIMGNLLELLIKIRDRENAKEARSSLDFEDSISSEAGFREKQESPDGEICCLIWDDCHIKKLVGNQEECLWIAEQLWNIATQFMSFGDPSSENERYNFLAAEFFAKAHDISLFSEEEKGVQLTKGHLSFENFDGLPHVKKEIDFRMLDQNPTTDICSEFSAQCLVLSVANAVDYVYLKEDTLCSEQEQYLIQSANRLVAVMNEISEVDKTEVGKNLSQSSIWLCLHLLIALKDDLQASLTLTTNGLLDQLRREVTSETTLQRSSDGKQEYCFQPLSRIFDIACQAESNHMPGTTSRLFTICAQELIRRKSISIIPTDPGEKQDHTKSIGSIQRKIIRYASTVEAAMSIFEQVDLISEDSSYNPYTPEDIDFFVVEAHNRAVSLVFIGDIRNAEKFIIISLNLLPRGGMEVESYGSEIRRTYRGIVEQEGCGGGSMIPFSSRKMVMNLFGKNCGGNK